MHFTVLVYYLVIQWDRMKSAQCRSGYKGKKSHFRLGDNNDIFSNTFAEGDIKSPAVVHMDSNIK